jgi:acyl-CoA thioester hydrolase
MKENLYIWESKVRDYEVDGQGIVNNATYLNYLEQSRNEYARAVGIDFVEYYQEGYHFVVAGVDIEFKNSLRAADEYYVTTKLCEFNEKRMHFLQEIYRKKDDKLMAKALVKTACMDIHTRKACMPEKLNAILVAIHHPR